MKNIIVIAGTSDARQLINKLLTFEIKVFATVTTEYGKSLLMQDNMSSTQASETISKMDSQRIIPNQKYFEVLEGKLTSGEMQKLISDNNSICIIDASHPYAKEASINAMQACELAGIPYIRYERSACAEVHAYEEEVIHVASYEEAASVCNLIKGNILVTTGSNTITTFTSIIEDYEQRLFCRVLPTSGILSKCEKAGLTASNIIAIKGPFSYEMNLETIRHCKAKVLVTKDSGDEGGTYQKLQAARVAEIKVIMIGRPKIEYKNKFTSIDDVMKAVKTFVSDEQGGG